jgi:uncharacterized membrane protein
MPSCRDFFSSQVSSTGILRFIMKNLQTDTGNLFKKYRHAEIPVNKKQYKYHMITIRLRSLIFKNLRTTVAEEHERLDLNTLV